MRDEFCPVVQFQFFDKHGQKINVSQDLVTSAVWGRTVNSVGKAVLTMPSDCTDIDFKTLSQEDLGLLINVADKPGQAMLPDLQTYWFMRRFKETSLDNKGVYKLTFSDANHLLDRRIVAYQADDPEGTSVNARIAEPGNIALKRIFDTNFGTLAGIRDLNPYLRSGTIAAPSPIINKEIQWKNVLSTMKQICRTSRDEGTPLFFDLVALPTATDVRFEFRTYIGQRGVDKTFEDILTTNPLFKLTSFEIDYDKANVAYVGGIGRGQDRQVAISTNARSTSGRYTRYEEFKSVRSGIFEVLEDEGKNIVNNVAGEIRLEGQLLGPLASHFDFGDRLRVLHRGFEIDCEVASISSSLSLQEYTRSVVIKSSQG